MQLDLTAAERALVQEWRTFTAPLTAEARTAWTRQGWIPRGVVDAAPHQAVTGAAWIAEPSEAIAIMEAARLHEGAPELLASSMLRRFLERPPGPAAPSNGSREAAPAACLILPGWTPDAARPSSLTCRRSGPGLRVSGVGSALAADCSAARAWVVATFTDEESGGGCVAEMILPPQQAAQSAGGGRPDGYQVLHEHAPARITEVQVRDAAAARLLTSGQVTAFRDLVRIGAACVLVGLIDTFFDAIVADAQRKAAASGDRWAAQADKHRAVGIAIRRDVAWLHLFKALDAFGDPEDRAVFSALALAEAAHGLDDAIADRRRIAYLEGDDDVLGSVALASRHRGFWLDLAGGSGGLTEAISASRLGNRTKDSRLHRGR